MHMSHCVFCLYHGLSSCGENLQIQHLCFFLYPQRYRWCEFLPTGMMALGYEEKTLDLCYFASGGGGAYNNVKAETQEGKVWG